MEFTTSEWNGYECLDFKFEGYDAFLVKPKCAPNGKWALKTEYRGAFPATECELLSRGWHVAFRQNKNRWATRDQIECTARFVKFISEEFSLVPRCSTVGMSCGGLIATTLAEAHPELIDVLYIDAPVLNLLSCPCGMGVAEDKIFEEFYRVTGYTKSAMLAYRDHPIDKMHILLAHDIPVLLVAGDSDGTVPYVENGKVLADYYQKNGGRIHVWVKEGCDHHPHGLTGQESIIVDLMEQLSKENEEKRAKNGI